MKYKKSIIVIMLAIFIFSIAAVSASDVNDTVIASEDTGQMELSAGDEITEDNIQTNENILTQASTDETVNASNEQDVLTFLLMVELSFLSLAPTERLKIVILLITLQVMVVLSVLWVPQVL